MIDLEDLIFISLVGSDRSDDAYPVHVHWAHAGGIGHCSMDLRPASGWDEFVPALIRSKWSPARAVWLPEAAIRLQEDLGRHIVLSDRPQRDTVLLDHLYEAAGMVRPFPVSEARDVYEHFLSERALAPDLRARAEATAEKAFAADDDETRDSHWLLRFTLVERYALTGGKERFTLSDEELERRSQRAGARVAAMPFGEPLPPGAPEVIGRGTYAAGVSALWAFLEDQSTDKFDVPALLRALAEALWRLHLDEVELAALVGAGSVESLTRWYTGQVAPPDPATLRRRVLDLLELYRALQVSHRWEPAESEAWLRTPNASLGGESPLDRLKRDPGSIAAVQVTVGTSKPSIPEP